MYIKPSTILSSDYSVISALAHQSGEPIYITQNGEGDVVVMGVEAFEAREKQLAHRAKILEAEISRLSGEPVYSVADIRNKLKERYKQANG